jgi:hypothetical protein
VSGVTFAGSNATKPIAATRRMRPLPRRRDNHARERARAIEPTAKGLQRNNIAHRVGDDAADELRRGEGLSDAPPGHPTDPSGATAAPANVARGVMPP